jgi:tetratricopeptide (TPR) repeat protein
LPDEGPRAEGNSREQGILDLAWQEGLAAYKKGAWSEATRFFEKIAREYPDSHLMPATLAFLAELALHEGPDGRDRAGAIQLYKKLLRDYPNSPNASRAEWRLGDLYLEQNWLQEAQSYYEKAMAHPLNLPFDGNRALLGLGYTFMAMRKWSDAEHAFMNLRKRADQDGLSHYATLGLAHALYKQHRLAEAQAFYELSYKRSPALFRLDPLAIHRFALTQVTLRHDASARELMLLLYNLYPRHESAPTALLFVAQSMATMSKLSQAEFFYSLVPSMYPASVQSTTAAMRLAALRAENRVQTDENRVGLAVGGMMRNVPTPAQGAATYEEMLKGIAAQESDSPIGGEALVHLGKHYEKTNDMRQALQAYKDAALRAGPPGDPWTAKASERLSALLSPWIEAALKSHDDLRAISLFHRYGAGTGQMYAQSPLLIELAEAHRRLGFAIEAGRLYQQLAKTKDPVVLEQVLVGLGKSYLDQEDPPAARKVLERYRFQFPDGRYESEVLHLLVIAMRRQGDLQGVLHLCRQWLLHHPKHGDRPYMSLQVAEVLGQLEQLEESIVAYEDALKADGKPSIESLLAYADTLSRMKKHERAIAAYHAALDRKPAVHQTEWIHLQTARHWHELKQYDRATVALAEVGETDDPLINRFTASFKDSLRAARGAQPGEGL